MKIKPYLVKITAWFIIVLWLSRSLLFRLLHIDFASHYIEEDFRKIWLLIIPFSVGILVVKSWKEIKFTLKRIVEFGLSIILSFGLILLLNFFSSFCGWDYSKSLYKHRTKDKEIKFRILDCGAMDGNPTYELVVTKKIGSYLIIYSKILKNEINEQEWIKE
ncbi:MAG: hypothetical protein ACOYO1_13720 [Bacteroidales bacterium]